MSEGYLRELKGKRWLTEADYAAKQRKEMKAFKHRLATLPASEAVRVCHSLLSMPDLDAPTSRICTDYLASQKTNS